MKKRSWPEWWDWDIEYTPHLLKRMEDRNFNEADLTDMLQRSKSYKKDIIEGRWVIKTQHEQHHLWEIIVEPDSLEKLLVVVTAYPVWID